ncbi:MAG: SCP2 sterol-binding domain-containing protein [Clostridiales bacterium]|nr:SCP2 sterol-binding domain-containing protein [Clostridia bacterium]MCR4563720.1 SCP2 sterol-binding domain-containing protein [Clostridiales bacterium]
MTYEQVVEKVRSKFVDSNAKKIDGVVALQVNLEGKNTQGIFYIEVKDHKVNVEPYDYYDHNAIVTVNPTNLIKLLEGKLDPKAAFESGKVIVDGDIDAVLKVLKLAK